MFDVAPWSAELLFLLLSNPANQLFILSKPERKSHNFRALPMRLCLGRSTGLSRLAHSRALLICSTIRDVLPRSRETTTAGRRGCLWDLWLQLILAYVFWELWYGFQVLQQVRKMFVCQNCTTVQLLDFLCIFLSIPTVLVRLKSLAQYFGMDLAKGRRNTWTWFRGKTRL